MNSIGMRSAVYSGSLMHHRLSGPSHRFAYPLFMWLLDLDELPGVARRLVGFGHNRAAAVSFHECDHFDGTGEAVTSQLRRVVERHGAAWPGGPVRVLTHCRVMGYVFNPVSFWFCHAPDGRIDTVVAEVNNTFGERHAYVASNLQSTQASARPPACLAWADKKVFHVSPFLSLDGTYAFAVEAPSDRLRARIDLRVEGALRFTATLALRREELSRTSVPRMLVRYPFMTARVIGAIHWEAFRLWRRRATYHAKPPYDPERARHGVA